MATSLKRTNPRAPKRQKQATVTLLDVPNDVFGLAVEFLEPRDITRLVITGASVHAKLFSLSERGVALHRVFDHWDARFHVPGRCPDSPLNRIIPIESQLCELVFLSESEQEVVAWIDKGLTWWGSNFLRPRFSVAVKGPVQAVHLCFTTVVERGYLRVTTRLLRRWYDAIKHMRPREAVRCYRQLTDAIQKLMPIAIRQENVAMMELLATDGLNPCARPKPDVTSNTVAVWIRENNVKMMLALQDVFALEALDFLNRGRFWELVEHAASHHHFDMLDLLQYPQGPGDGYPLAAIEAVCEASAEHPRRGNLLRILDRMAVSLTCTGIRKEICRLCQTGNLTVLRHMGGSPAWVGRIQPGRQRMNMLAEMLQTACLAPVGPEELDSFAGPPWNMTAEHVIQAGVLAHPRMYSQVGLKCPTLLGSHWGWERKHVQQLDLPLMARLGAGAGSKIFAQLAQSSLAISGSDFSKEAQREILTRVHTADDHATLEILRNYPWNFTFF